MNIVLTREAGSNDSLRSWLPSDATVLDVPLTETRYYEPSDVRDALVRSAANGQFRSLVVTSERSIDYVSTALAASTGDVDVYSVGPATSHALIALGVKVRAQSGGAAVTLARQISRGPALVLGAQTMREELAVALRDRGLDVMVVACYETLVLSPSSSDEELLRGADVLFIGAPSAWAVAQSFVRPDAWIVVPGASTGAVVRAEHQRVIEGWGPALVERLARL